MARMFEYCRANMSYISFEGGSWNLGFHYKDSTYVKDISPMEELNKLGKEGWELVTVIMKGEDGTKPLTYEYFFKREIGK